jgi:hypothetical protein
MHRVIHSRSGRWLAGCFFAASRAGFALRPRSQVAEMPTAG